MKTTQKSLISLLLLAVLLAACSPGSSATPSAGTTAWVDQPVTNALLPLAPFTIRGHASRPGGGIVKMSFMVNSVEVGNAGTDASEAIVSGEAVWTPSAPGVYSIQVLAFGMDGITYSEASRVCVSALSDISALPGFLGDCGSPIPTLPDLTVTSPATVTPPTPTDTPPSGNQGIAIQNANCHVGPGTVFPVLSYVPKGTSVNVTGLSEDGLWLFVKPCGLGPGWVLASFIETSFNLSTLPILIGPPTPTPIPPTVTPVPFFDCAAAYGVDTKACMADPRCSWNGKSCVNP